MILRKILIPSSIFFVMILTASCTEDKDDTINLRKPSIERFSPSSGATGTIVNIEGTGFLSEGGGTTVLFGEDLVKIEEITANNIQLAIPAGHVGESLPFKIINNNTDGEYVESVEKFTVSTPEFGGFYPKIDTTGAVISFPGKNFGNKLTSSRQKIYLVENDGDRYEMQMESASDSLMKAKITLKDGKYRLLAVVEGHGQMFKDTLTVSPRFDFDETLTISAEDRAYTFNVRVYTHYFDVKFTLENFELEGWRVPTRDGYTLYRIIIPEGFTPGAYKVTGFVNGIPAVPRNSGIVYLE